LNLKKTNFRFMLKIILLSALLILIATVALAIRIIIKPEGEFSGGTCNSASKKLKDKGIQCTCGKTEPCHNL
jgi:hypothetical protein